MKTISGSSSINAKELQGENSLNAKELTGSSSLNQKELTGDSVTDFQAAAVSTGGFDYTLDFGFE